MLSRQGRSPRNDVQHGISNRVSHRRRGAHQRRHGPQGPVLSPDDANFVDARKGGGWGDRCFTEIKQGKWGWAHTACDRALALPDVDPKVRPLLLYNEGLIAKHAGDSPAARNYFGQSLALRSPTDPGRTEVEKELTSVGGAVPSTPVETFTGKDPPSLCTAAVGKTVVRVLGNVDTHTGQVLIDSPTTTRRFLVRPTPGASQARGGNEMNGHYRPIELLFAGYGEGDQKPAGETLAKDSDVGAILFEHVNGPDTLALYVPPLDKAPREILCK
jgi:hypothetical protein